MTAEQPRIAEMLAQTAAEDLRDGTVRIPPFGRIRGNDAVIQTGTRVLFRVAGECIAAHFVCGFVAVDAGEFIGKRDCEALDLRVGVVVTVLMVNPCVVQLIAEKLGGELEFQLKGRYFVRLTEGQRGNDTPGGCPDGV